MRNFLKRPLTQNQFFNSIFYGILFWITNNLINFPYITPENPEGITGREGFAIMLTLAIFFSYLSAKENQWVRELKAKTG